MKEFSPNSDIDFPLPLHTCCDVCARKCVCECCHGHDREVVEQNIESEPADASLDISMPRSEKQQLMQALTSYRDSQCYILDG